MATKKGAKKPTSSKVAGKRAKTGAARRNTQKRVGKPGVITPADTSTPAKAAEWLNETARSEMAAGRTLRTTAQLNSDAYERIAEACRPWAAELKGRAVHPNLILGAGLVRDKLVALGAASDESPPSTTVARTVALLSRRRNALNRLLPGSRNAKTRKAFGLNAPVNAKSPSTVIAACKAIVSGEKKAKNTPAADYINAADVKWFTAQWRAIEAEQSEAAVERSAGMTQTTTRDIQTAALEIFYDKFAAGIDAVIDDEVLRLDALKLIPRREERRGQSEDGGGTGSGGDGTGA